MSIPGRHSLFWKLCGLLVLLCLLVLWLSRSGGAHLERKSYHLSPAAQATLAAYSAEAHAAWRDGGAAGVDDWLARLPGREPGWAMVVGSNLESLASRPLDATQRRYVTFMRKAEWPMSKRSPELPAISLPFPGAEQHGQLVMQLPQRFMPSGLPLLVRGLVNWLFPAALALLAGGLLYRVLIGPLAHLQAQANALRADRLDTRVAPAVSQRNDELGDLGRAFDHMAERLQHTVLLQRRLLADLSHELRTPLSRLQVAAENDDGGQALRERVNREVDCMRQLVDDTLELVWLDTERPRLIAEAVDVETLWELLRENACFEAGWPPERMPSLLQDGCRVRGHLNGLAQAMENILRNAIRHSPAHGQVSLGGKREAEHWHLWIDDQGPGVADAALESIFLPFTRLDAARPGGEGFGLGLAIARYRVQLQGGQLWAENLNPGLRLNLRLPA